MATAALQILHLEDNQADAALVEALLQSEGITSRVVCVKTRAEYEAALERAISTSFFRITLCRNLTA